MKKRKSSSLGDKFLGASVWFFLVGFIISGVVAVFALRQNNLNAIELRDKVLQVDEKGGDVEEALRELREYVYAHMNADLSTGTGIQQPIQLKFRYDRLVKQEQKRVEKANEKIYPQAQKFCEKQNSTSFSGGGRVACIENYVLNNGEKEKEIPDDLYKFDFVSPRWSPDLAGWSIVAAGIFLLLFIIKLGLDRWLKSELSE